MKNTEKLANSTIEKIKSEFNYLENEKNQCLSIFRETANDLQKISEEIDENRSICAFLISELTEQCKNLEQARSYNDKVLNKILDIID